MQPVIPTSTSQAKRVHTPAISDCRTQGAQTRMPPGLVRSTPLNHSGPQVGHGQQNTSKNKTGTRNRFVKLRLSSDEYADVANRADAAGVTLCEHIRRQLLAVHEAFDVRHELSILRGQLASGAPAAADTLVQEMVLILRELAAARDAHILSRVRAQLAAGGAR